MEERSLRRVLGRWDLTAIGVNQVIGSGVFVLPATVAALVGVPASPFVWCFAAGVNALIVISFAQVASQFRDAGGPYLYSQQAFGDFVGFEVGWMLWLTRVTTQAALANALVIYSAYFLPELSRGSGRLLAITLTILLLMMINLFGVREGSWTVNLFTLGKLLPLLVFISAGLFHVDWSRFKALQQPTWDGFGEAALLLMFAFGGYELITLPAGEALAPKKDVPSALLVTIAIVSLLYVSVQIVAAGTLAGLAQSQTPLADAAGQFLGPVSGTLIALGGLIAIAGSNSGTMLAGPRVTFAMSQQGQLPPFLAHVHKRYCTPDVSILIYSGSALLLAFSGTFVQMVAVSAVARLIFYITTCAAVPVLRRRRVIPPAKSQAAVWVPILALVCSLGVAFGADAFSLAVSGGALILGAGFYLLHRRGAHPKEGETPEKRALS